MIFNKNVIRLSGALLALMFVFNGQAQALKIGVIDETILQEKYEPLNEALKALDARVSSELDEVKVRQDKLIREIKDFDRKRDLMTDKEMIKEKEIELAKESKMVQRYKKQTITVLREERVQTLTPFLSQIKKAVEAVAKREKYDIIFKRYELAYFSPSVDITQKVLDYLDKQKPDTKPAPKSNVDDLNKK
jgi:outer membrane protein